MGKSKNLHFVEHTITIEQPDDANLNWAEGVIQVDAKLAEQLGRQIRNGISMRLVGYGASLRGYNGSSDQDIGFSGVTVVAYCPVTKNSVGAWQSLQKQWMRQKQLSGGVGKYVRYDDFELGWDPARLLTPLRNSKIRMSGINDASDEAVGIYGDSTDGVYVGLESYYDKLNPIPNKSNDPFGNTIKVPKFPNKFPDAQSLFMATSFSGMPFEIADPVVPYTVPVGGIASGAMQWLPADNHISHLTGTLYYYFKGVTPDNAIFNADELKLTITLAYEGWAPLAKVRSAKSNGPKLTSAKKTTRARRRS